MDETTKSAGFWIRLGAHCIDGFIMAIPYLVFSYLMGGRFVEVQVAYFFLFAVYYVGFISSAWQATPGKRIGNIYIVRADNHAAIGKWRAFFRYLCIEIPALFLVISNIFLTAIERMTRVLSAQEQHLAKIMSVIAFFCTAYIMILIFTVAPTREKTGLHDMICKTRALRGRPQMHV